MLEPIPQRRPKCMPLASRDTLAWYRATYAKTGLCYKQVQRLKMLSYGVFVRPEEMNLNRKGAKDQVSRLRKRLPWLVIKCDRLRGYYVQQPYRDQLKAFLESE